jgi:hypothetical protein
VASHSTNDALLLPDEAPDPRCVSKLLGITMLQLWEVFVKCKLSKKKGQFHMIIDQELEDCMQRIGLIGFLVLGESNKVLLMRLGISQSDQSAVNQWKSKRRPRPLHHSAKRICDNPSTCLKKEKKTAPNKNVSHVNKEHSSVSPLHSGTNSPLRPEWH